MTDHVDPVGAVDEGAVYLVRLDGGYDKDTFVGVFSERRLAELAAHHPWASQGRVHRVEIDVPYEGWPADD